MRTPFSLILSFCLLTLPTSLHSQSVVKSFDGDKGPGIEVCKTGRTHCGWPDMDGAANGEVFAQVTWQNVSVYDYDGKLLKAIPTATFIKNAGLNPIPPGRQHAAGVPADPGPYEGHIVFDEFIDRWVMSITGFSDSLLVSATSDPLGAWGGVNLSCLHGGPCLNFDPALHLGYDKNGVYYCGGHMGETNPHTIKNVSYDCFAIPSAEVTGIAGGKAPEHINRGHMMPHEILIAIDHNKKKAPGAPAWFMAKTCDLTTVGGCQNAKDFEFEWLAVSFTWNGPTGAYHEQVVKTDVGSTSNKWLYNKPCCGTLGIIPQKGNDAVALRGVESHRFNNVFQHGSHIHGVMGSGPCTADCGAQGTDTNNLGFWVDMDCSNPKACVVSQTAKIADKNVSFATVGVDSAGNVGIVGESWSATSYLSLMLWTHKVSDPPNFISPATTIVAGTQPYTCTNEKGFANVGNPAGVLTALDPADGTKLWVSHQYANDATPCVWNTRIVEYQIAGALANASKKAKPKNKA